MGSTSQTLSRLGLLASWRPGRSPASISGSQAPDPPRPGRGRSCLPIQTCSRGCDDRAGDPDPEPGQACRERQTDERRETRRRETRQRGQAAPGARGGQVARSGAASWRPTPPASVSPPSSSLAPNRRSLPRRWDAPGMCCLQPPQLGCRAEGWGTRRGCCCRREVLGCELGGPGLGVWVPPQTSLERHRLVPQCRQGVSPQRPHPVLHLIIHLSPTIFQAQPNCGVDSSPEPGAGLEPPTGPGPGVLPTSRAGVRPAAAEAGCAGGPGVGSLGRALSLAGSLLVDGAVGRPQLLAVAEARGQQS